jgi:hypothetical protein
VQFHPRISEKLEETCGKKIQIVKCQTKESLLLACDLRKLHPGRHRAKFSW